MNNNNPNNDKHSFPDGNEKRKEYPRSVDPKMVENRQNKQIPNKPWEDDPERYDVNYQPARQFLNYKSGEDIENQQSMGMRVALEYMWIIWMCWTM